MKCKNLKIRSKKGLKYAYCIKYKKEVSFYCKNKSCAEYEKIKPIKKRTSKQSKMGKNRFSIITNNLDSCILCGAKKDNLHEIFFGASRLNSIRYGLVIPLCVKCHQEMHSNKQLQDYWHKVGQQRFYEVYPDLDFIDIFKKNYL